MYMYILLYIFMYVVSGPYQPEKPPCPEGRVNDYWALASASVLFATLLDDTRQVLRLQAGCADGKTTTKSNHTMGQGGGQGYISPSLPRTARKKAAVGKTSPDCDLPLWNHIK